MQLPVFSWISVFSRNLIKYISVQHIWNLSQQIYLETSSLKRGNNVPKLPGVDYVAKNWALAMMLKALPLVHFWSTLSLREQMMTSVRKTFKMLVLSAQNRSISSKIFAENNHKIGHFSRLLFAKFAPKIPVKLADFSTNLSLKIQRNLTFFRNLLEALHSKAWSIRFENTTDRSRYKFGGKLALFMRFGTFFMMKAKQDNMKCLC